jgi:riboflavin synthase alpha subunit
MAAAIIHFEYDASLNNLTIEKGSTVNGVSLTVVNSKRINLVLRSYHTHTIIPTLKSLVGTKVNLEFDVIGNMSPNHSNK